MTLYQLNQEQMQINAMLEASEGEITPEIEAMLSINDQNLTMKAGQYRNAIMNNSMEIEAAKAEIKRLQAFCKSKERDSEIMSQRIKDAMTLRGMKEIKIDGGIGGRFSFRASKQVVVDDETKLPDTCFVTKRELSKTAIKDAIEAGTELEGAHIEERQNLQVK